MAPSFLTVLLSYQVFFVISRYHHCRNTNSNSSDICNCKNTYNIILDSQLVSSVVILIIAAIMSTLSNSITTDAFDIIAGVSTSGISILAHCMFLSFFFPGDSTIYAMGGYTGDKKQQKAILDDFVRQIVLYDRDGKEMLPTVNHQ